jgi:predicted TPR repeat methyltransferase
MLRLAGERQVYDELEKSELVDYLRLHRGRFDLLISADTLCYFGELHDVTQAAFAALRAGGRLVFTVEALADESADSGKSPNSGESANSGECADSALDRRSRDDYRLLLHGRYAHAREYLGRVLSRAGFVVEDLVEERLRFEAGLPVSGWLVGAVKR